MKKRMNKLISITVSATMLLSAATMVTYAEEEVVLDKPGDGDYNITVANGSDTGISIEGDLFHAYQIFAADDVTSYSVTEEFRDFFDDTKTGGDGSDTDYDFDQYLDIVELYEDEYLTPNTEDATELAEYNVALDNYNQLAGAYMDSFENNMYALAVEMRAYLDSVGSYTGNGTVECMAHASAGTRQDDGYEYATIEGLYTGYYFIFDQESTMNGIGIAASGAFVPLTTASSNNTTIEVKQSIPTMTKSIYHDDEAKWDIVGDSQIGDEVKFRVISTLPSNIDDYTLDDESPNAIDKYDYILTDVMSEGLTYNQNLEIYMADGTSLVDAKYYTVENAEDGSGFTLTFEAIDFLTDYPNEMTLISYYSGTLNEKAVVASDYDENTASLTYSSNPNDATHFGTTESTVFHYTFALDVNKVDENGDGLAGARFGIFDEDGYALPLSKGETDYTTGVVSYYYDLAATVADSDGGYITTETVELQDDSGEPTGETATGKFVIYGLNDKITYTLREVEAPNGYNTTDAFDIYFTATYSALGTEITYLTDGSAYVNTALDAATSDWSSTSTIVNRMKIYLPETGGIGTTLFQVGGGVLMLAAAAMLLLNKSKKEENEANI